MRTAAHNAETQSVSYYWGLIKDLDDRQKLELASLIIESVRHAAAKAAQVDSLSPYTMAEIDAMLDEAEAAFESGDYLTQDEVFHHRESMTV